MTWRWCGWVGGALLATGCGGRSADASSIAGGSGAGGSSDGTAPRITEPLSEEQYQALTQSTCDKQVVTPTAQRTSLYWLIDASESMNSKQKAADGTTESVWQAARSKVKQALDDMLTMDNCQARSVGMLVYPGMSSAQTTTIQPQESDACIDTSQGSYWTWLDDPAAATASMQQLLDSVEPTGGSPMADALSYLSGRVLADGSSDSKAIVWVNDAMPSIDPGCVAPSPANDPASGWLGNGSIDDAKAATAAITKVISSSNAKGLKTFVVNAVGYSEQTNWLTAAAREGGTVKPECTVEAAVSDCHFSLADGSYWNLGSVLGQVFSQSVRETCKFSLYTSAPINPILKHMSLVTPVITLGNGQRMRVYGDPERFHACTWGFRFLSFQDAELCPEACELLRSDCDAKLEVLYECPDVQPEG